ncbi:hypothetical protein HYX07_04710 [Candidatus Woesearchaeota archaeon]|nr:hypothetical protein [Candidatus Woesearchaeota archaeon]
MEGLKDFYLKKKRALQKIVHIPQKDDTESQETLNRHMKALPRLKKFKEAEYFREEFMEPQIDEARSQA